jgi:hypothetical protein
LVKVGPRAYVSLASVLHWTVIEGSELPPAKWRPPPPPKRYTSCRRPGCCAVAH